MCRFASAVLTTEEYLMHYGRTRFAWALPVACLIGGAVSTESLGPGKVPAAAEDHSPDPPRGYVCYRVKTAPALDGKLDDDAWRAAPWSEDFRDIEGDRRPAPRLRTRVKMLWDDECLYIGAELEEPHVWATLTRHDSVIFHDNDFEVFLDPDGDSHLYAELELNALNTTGTCSCPSPTRTAVEPWTPGKSPGCARRSTSRAPSTTRATGIAAGRSRSPGRGGA